MDAMQICDGIATIRLTPAMDIGPNLDIHIEYGGTEYGRCDIMDLWLLPAEARHLAATLTAWADGVEPPQKDAI